MELFDKVYENIKYQIHIKLALAYDALTFFTITESLISLSNQFSCKQKDINLEFKVSGTDNYILKEDMQRITRN